MQHFSNSVLLWVVALAVVVGAGCSPSEITPAEANQMLKQAGGVKRINEEARLVFDKYGQGETFVLGKEDLAAAPSIRALGNAFIFTHEPGSLPYLEIRFGSHRDPKFLIIYDPGISTNVGQVAPYLRSTRPSERGVVPYLQVTTNIFITRQ